MKEWNEFLTSLEQYNLGSSTQTWTAHCLVEKFDAQNLYLKFSDVFALNFFKEHVGPKLKNFKNANNHPIKVHLELDASKSKFVKDTHLKEVVFNFEEDSLVTFDDFVTDSENRFVFEMLHNLKDTTATFNPFFIYGAQSSGKTHLLKAACNYYKKQGLNCLFVDAERFSEHVVYAMKQSSMNEFRKVYRSIDMLFVDNIQLLGGKTATQEEFFHTFNSLHMSGKTVVLASDTPASFLKNIEPRLISRFEWGLSIELPQLGKNSYPELIEKLSKYLSLELTLEHKKTLIEHFSQDTASLTSAIHAIVLRSHLDKDTSNRGMHATLEDLKDQKKPITADDIVAATAKFFNLKAKEIKGPSQTRPLAFPRQISMYLVRKHLNMPYKKMGEFYSRDHSTVMASITVIEERLKNLDEETLNAIKRIEWELKQ